MCLTTCGNHEFPDCPLLPRPPISIFAAFFFFFPSPFHPLLILTLPILSHLSAMTVHCIHIDLARYVTASPPSAQ